jgi:hypothetical protein
VGDWEPVNRKSAVIAAVQRGHYASVVAYGQEGGGPFAAVIDPERGVHRLHIPGSGPVSWVAVSEEIELVVDEVPPLHVLGGGISGSAFRVIHDAEIEDMVRLWPVCGDEDPQVVVLTSTGRLKVVDVGGGDPPEGDGLWLVADDLKSAPLLVGQGQTAAFVAGRVRGGHHDPGEQLWVSDFYNGWQQVHVDPAPDQFTDVFSGMFPAFAGHRERLPVLFDESGTNLDAPAVPLDPDHPQVCVASTRDRTVLALQSAEGGPQLWLGEAGRWAVEPLPPGRLRAARLTGDSHVWVVIDGRVWHGTDLWPPQAAS